ncbi:MAG: zinc-binding alcohol dehydrogenase family protein [Armatimonadota bacterium]|nr:MAG: zinc-binding alcohol dehydrogenase family protein [Armatimonadota bacterium]
MKALILEAPQRARVTEAPEPSSQPGEALVRVLAAGICGTDRHAYAGEHPVFSYPRIPGHEFAGHVVAAPADSGVNPGDLVVGDPAVSCGECYPCRQGRYNCCVNVSVMGVHRDGALAELVALPAANLHRVPSGISAQDAVLAEPVAIGLQAIHRGRLQRGESVAILGAGPIGLSALQVAKAMGARTFVTELRDDRMDFARRFGADAVVHADTAPGAAAEFTHGDGFPLVIEAAGEPRAVGEALELVAAAGRVILLGLIREPIPIAPWTLIQRELDLLGSRMTTGAIPEALHMIADGAVQPQPMVTHHFPLDRADDALELAARAPNGVEKVIVVMPGG